MTPLHVLHVMANAIVGGMEHWVLRHAQQLPREAFRFSALCPFESPMTEKLRDAGVAVHIAPVTPDPPWTSLQAASELVRSEGVDLLHAHMPPAHLLAGVAGAITHRPVLTTIHARQLETLDVEVHRALHTHVSVVCRQSYHQALGLGIAPGLLSCEPNGVDGAAFAPRERPGRLRAELGLADDAPLIGFVGRLSGEKGPEVLVRAALLARLRQPALHFVFVGDGPMAGELRQLAAALGQQDHVHLVGVRDDPAAVYAELDLLVSCSHSEALPLVLLEAMACGLPTIATRVGGVPEVVLPGHTGLLLSPGDFDALAQACVSLMADAPRREAMGRRAREHVMRHFALADSAQRVGRLMQRLARGPAADGSVVSLRGAARGPAP